MDVEYDRDPDEVVASSLEGGQLPRNDALKQIVLERLVEKFEVGETYEKRAVNDVLAEHFEDYVLVRRELVNFGYMRYDNTANTFEVRKTELSEQDYRENTRLRRHAEDLGLLD